MYKFIFLIAILFCSINLFSQQCGTVTPSNPVIVNSVKSAFTSYTFRVYYHSICRNNGKKCTVSATEIFTAHQALNAYFLSSNICFSLSGIDYIESNELWDYYESDFAGLTQTNTHTDGIDVYIFKGSDNVAYNGRANGIPGNGLVITRNSFVSSTFPHEMGHVLGLYHTFEPFVCVEAENGSNSSSCGDLVQDTPAHPNSCQYSNTNCQFSCPSGFSPLTNNFMTYTDEPTCRTSFTQGQRNRMYAIIEQTPDLQNRLVPTNRTININVPYAPLASFPSLLINDIILEAKGAISAFDVNVVNPGKLALRAEQEVVLYPGFDAFEGSRLLVTIDNICSVNESTAKAKTSLVEYYENYGTRIDEQLQNESTTNNVEEVTILNDFNVICFPNPFNDVFSIAIKNLENYGKDERANIVIRDLNGRVFLSQSCAIEDLDQGIEINTLGLAKGVFIVQIDLQDTRYFTRVVKS